MEKLKALFGLYFLFVLLSFGLGMGVYCFYKPAGIYVFGIGLILSSITILVEIFKEAKE